MSVFIPLVFYLESFPLANEFKATCYILCDIIKFSGKRIEHPLVGSMSKEEAEGGNRTREGRGKYGKKNENFN